jgi:hypothetical protein
MRIDVCFKGSSLWYPPDAQPVMGGTRNARLEATRQFLEAILGLVREAVAATVGCNLDCGLFLTKEQAAVLKGADWTIVLDVSGLDDPLSWRSGPAVSLQQAVETAVDLYIATHGLSSGSLNPPRRDVRVVPTLAA